MFWVKFIILQLLTFYSVNTRAFSLDSNLFYQSDTLSTSTESGSTKTFIDLSANLDLTKKGSFTIGFSYATSAISDKISGTDTGYGLTEMGIRFGYFIDKDRSWGLFATYNLVVTGSYDDGSSEVEWRGGSYKIETGYRPMISEVLAAGIHLVYHSATFSEELASGSSYSTVSYSRGLIYPAISISYRID